jgi:hypothetical protein
MRASKPQHERKRLHRPLTRKAEDVCVEEGERLAATPRSAASAREALRERGPCSCTALVYSFPRKFLLALIALRAAEGLQPCESFHQSLVLGSVAAARKKRLHFNL